MNNGCIVADGDAGFGVFVARSVGVAVKDFGIFVGEEDIAIVAIPVAPAVVKKFSLPWIDVLSVVARSAKKYFVLGCRSVSVIPWSCAAVVEMSWRDV